MTDQVQDIPMITVDGTNYIIPELPQEVQDLITHYQNWNLELMRQRVEAFKTEAAMRAVSVEIETRIRVMAATQAEEAKQNEELKAAATEALHESLAANDDASPANEELLDILDDEIPASADMQ